MNCCTHAEAFLLRTLKAGDIQPLQAGSTRRGDKESLLPATLDLVLVTALLSSAALHNGFCAVSAAPLH